MKDGKLGDTAVKLEIEDDSLKPANAKQAADRMAQSGVKLFTGVNFSNVLAAVVPGVLESGGFYVSLNPGPRSSPARSATGTTSSPPIRTTRSTKRLASPPTGWATRR